MKLACEDSTSRAPEGGVCVQITIRNRTRTVALPLGVVHPRLRRRDHVALALRRPRPQQQLRPGRGTSPSNSKVNTRGDKKTTNSCTL